MKKRLCIFMICWLPCFVMAANLMSLQMQWAQLSAPAESQQAMHGMPCHSAMAATDTDKKSSSQAHQCAVCGFCVVSSGVAHLHGSVLLTMMNAASATPVFVVAPVHSQSYPPAIKPPIFG